MKAIYASKLYKASSRKSKIQASIEDPINLELVTQIKSYLDEEYQDTVDRLQAKQKAQLVENMIEENSDNKPNSQPSSMDGRSSGPSRGFGGSPQGGHPSLSEKFDMLLSEDDDAGLNNELDDSDVPQFDDPTESNLEDVEESTTIEGIDEITTSDKSNTSDLSSDVKSLLSSDESTSGINRVIAKKNELWIHYNDDINLNNVMAPVIEKLSSSHLDCLNFNRLARSENAIVFQLDSKCDSEVSDGV